MDLFSPQKKDFRISRISEGDSIDQLDLLNDFRSEIMEKETSYPEIGRWLKKQVIPQLGHPGRIAYVAHLDNLPVGTVVFKICDRLKLCHLHISDYARRRGLGDVFLGLVALQKEISAKNIYFTIPESVWDEQKDFFLRFGFRHRGQATRQYRLFDRELYCSAPFAEYSRVALQRLGDLTAELNFGSAREQPTLHPEYKAWICA